MPKPHCIDGSVLIGIYSAQDIRLWPPALYGTINRLVNASLIEPCGARPAAELNDARRRYYRLTNLGRRVLAAECARLEGLIRAVHARRGIRKRKAEA